MITLKEIVSERTSEDWDKELLRFKDYNFLQTHSYGEFEKTRSNNVLRFMLLDSDKPLVMAQGLMRKTHLGFNLFRFRGGPVYQISNNENVDTKNLRQFLQKLFEHVKKQYGPSYINIIMYGEHSVSSEIALRESGMTKPYLERAPYLTYYVPIHHDLTENMKAFDSKWRNQLRRAESYNLAFHWGNDDMLINRYVLLHNAMCSIKSINNFSLTAETIVKMRDHINSRLQFLIGDLDGEDVCGCCVIIVHKKAYYNYAAANERGRAGYFSNAAVWRLMQKLHEMNITELDISAVDPAKNWGGYHFKKGIGGRPAAYMGEWDHSFPSALKPLMNMVLSLRARQMYR